MYPLALVLSLFLVSSHFSAAQQVPPFPAGLNTINIFSDAILNVNSIDVPFTAQYLGDDVGNFQARLNIIVPDLNQKCNLTRGQFWVTGSPSGLSIIITQLSSGCYILNIPTGGTWYPKVLQKWQHANSLFCDGTTWQAKWSVSLQGGNDAEMMMMNVEEGRGEVQQNLLNIENNICLHPNGDINVARIIATLSDQRIETYVPHVTNLGIPTEARMKEERPDPTTCTPLSPPQFMSRLKRMKFF